MDQTVDVIVHLQPVLDGLVRRHRSEVFPHYPGPSLRPVFLDLDSGMRAAPGAGSAARGASPLAR